MISTIYLINSIKKSHCIEILSGEIRTNRFNNFYFKFLLLTSELKESSEMII